MARGIPEIVEEQVVKWRVAQAARRESPRGESARPNIVNIAREVGTPASMIARRVGELLAVPVYDHAIVEHIAAEAHVRLETVETLDEHVQNRVDEYLAALVHEHNFDRSDYLVYLARTVVALWEHGPCVLVGHGSAHLVPRDHALKVRLIAPFQLRAKRYAEEEHLTLPNAEQRLRRVDAEHEAFHRRFFAAKIDDQRAYDLILDAGRLSTEGCARMIVEGYRDRFGSPVLD